MTGGYFADPPYKTVPDLARLGFLYAEVQPNGRAEFAKLDGTGGVLSLATCKEQLLYEIHDPTRYVTPDLTADFSQVGLEGCSPDRVSASGATGRAKPDFLKVSLAYPDGYIGEGQITYAGSGAVDRGRLAIEVVEDRLNFYGCDIRELRTEMIGLNSTASTGNQTASPPEIRVRVAGRTRTAEEANLIAATVEALYTNGPAAGGGVSRSVRPVVAIASTLIPSECVQPEVSYLVT